MLPLSMARGVKHTRDVVYDNGNTGVTDVRRDQASESLLTSGIPELQAYGAVLEVHRLV
jgi:hypothetical protein